MGVSTASPRLWRRSRLPAWTFVFSLVLWVGCSRSGHHVPLGGKQTFLLLWVEESSTHLLPPRFYPDQGDGLTRSRLQLDEARRLVRIDPDALHELAASARPDASPQALVVQQIFDHDLLVAERLHIITERLHLLQTPLPRQVNTQMRLLPREIAWTSRSRTGDGQPVVLQVDTVTVSLPEGGTWSGYYELGAARPVQAGEDGWRDQVGDALDAGRPLTLLRISNLGWWRIVPGGEDA